MEQGETRSRMLGYVLSGAKSTEAYFEPVRDAEDYVREGMLVTIESRGRRLLGSVASIEARHELLEPGSLWSESIRQSQLPPLNAARRYLLARVTIYGEIRGNGLGTVDRPPEPGARVYEATPGDLRPLYGYLPGAALPPNVIEIGRLYGYTDSSNPLPASLDLDKLPMHFAVLGVTGSGKSNTMGVIIERLGSKKGVQIGSFKASTVPVIVFDANGDYLDYYRDPSLVPSYRVVRLVFSHAAKTTGGVEAAARLMELRIDLNTFRGAASELAEAIYAAVRGGSLEGLELQLDHLTRILSMLEEPEDGKEDDKLGEIRRRCSAPGGGVDLNRVFGVRRCVDLVVELVDELEGHRLTKAAVARTIRSFYELVSTRYNILALPGLPRIDESFIDDATSPRRPMLVIVDFSPEGAPGVELRLKQFIVYYFSRLILNRFTYYKTRNEPRVAMLVVEEAQNYIPNQREYPIGFSVARRYLALAATQGRKFGLSLALVTQRPGFVDPVVLSMMNTFIIHRVASGDTRFVQLATGGLPRHIASRLPLLETGVAVITGQMSPFPYPILAKMDKRESHGAGSL